jgi:hypothetical protein
MEGFEAKGSRAQKLIGPGDKAVFFATCNRNLETQKSSRPSVERQRTSWKVQRGLNFRRYHLMEELKFIE